MKGAHGQRRLALLELGIARKFYAERAGEELLKRVTHGDMTAESLA
jgi:hypothetical protein